MATSRAELWLPACLSSRSRATPSGTDFACTTARGVPVRTRHVKRGAKGGGTRHDSAQPWSSAPCGKRTPPSRFSARRRRMNGILYSFTNGALPSSTAGRPPPPAPPPPPPRGGKAPSSSASQASRRDTCEGASAAKISARRARALALSDSPPHLRAVGGRACDLGAAPPSREPSGSRSDGASAPNMVVSSTHALFRAARSNRVVFFMRGHPPRPRP